MTKETQPRLKFTDAMIRKLPTKNKKYYVLDPECIGLRIYVQVRTGAKAFYLQRCLKEFGYSKKTKIGDFPEMSIRDARKLGGVIKTDNVQGKDPIIAAAERAKEKTLGAIAAEYVLKKLDHRTNKTRSSKNLTADKENIDRWLLGTSKDPDIRKTWRKYYDQINIKAKQLSKISSEDIMEYHGAVSYKTSYNDILLNMEKILFYIKSLRPHQWIKNFLIFIPLLAAHQINKETIILAIQMFVSFSFIASSVYIFNDLIDLKADKSHPRKRYRPFASGKISVSHGKILALFLIVLGTMISLSISYSFLVILLIYFLISSAYSIFLKQKIIIDICILAVLYTIRIIAGGVVLNINLSVWLLAFSLFFFFSLAAVKRQAELVDLIKRKKLKSLNRGYQVKDLPIISMAALAAGYVSVLIMAFYVNSPDIVKLYSQPIALWGICLILIFWITKMIIVTHRGYMHDDPIVFAVKDFSSQICLLLIILFLSVGILF